MTIVLPLPVLVAEQTIGKAEKKGGAGAAGKPVKAAMILARSSEGNVRVRDVIRTYAVEGEEGVSELAWTSPLTKYLIEAYDAC